MKDTAETLYRIASRNTNSSQKASIDFTAELISIIAKSKLTPLALNAALLSIADLSKEFEALITAKLL